MELQLQSASDRKLKSVRGLYMKQSLQVIKQQTILHRVEIERLSNCDQLADWQFLPNRWKNN